MIDKNVNYLLGITNELLDFQKMESGTLHLNLKRVILKNLSVTFIISLQVLLN